MNKDANFINWNKAPKEATHAALDSREGVEPVVIFYKNIKTHCYECIRQEPDAYWKQGMGSPTYYPLYPRPIKNGTDLRSQFMNSERQRIEERGIVNWREGIDLPPVGDTVLFEHQNIRGQERTEVKIIAHTDTPILDLKVALFWKGTDIKHSVAENFFKTTYKRIEFLESVKSVFGCSIDKELYKFFNNLYDAGFKAPDKKE